MGDLLGASSTSFSGVAWVVVVAGLLAVALLVLIGIIRSFLFISKPSNALIISGKKSTLHGQEVGYSIVKQGNRGFKLPILHKVDELDMRLIPVDIVVQNAYSAGNIPLQIHAIANVKIHSKDGLITNAVERFLGQSIGNIQIVAQNTLEGAVREVVADLTPEEVNEDRLKFADRLIHSAEDDLHKLGLQLDTLKIQNVADNTGYLDSLGRPRIAAALRDAENAENTANQEIAGAVAAANRRAEVSRNEAEMAVLEKKNELRRITAELEGDVQSVEREAVAAAKTARARAEKSLQDVRGTLEEKRLRAEVIIPAEIKQRAKAILAIGEAAPTVENGAADVRVLEAMTNAWASMGPQAKEIYVIQHLEEIVGTVVGNLQQVDVGEVHVLDQGDGSGLSTYAATYPQMVSAVLSALAESTGVDVPNLLKDKGVSLAGGV